MRPASSRERYRLAHEPAAQLTASRSFYASFRSNSFRKTTDRRIQLHLDGSELVPLSCHACPPAAQHCIPRETRGLVYRASTPLLGPTRRQIGELLSIGVITKPKAHRRRRPQAVEGALASGREMVAEGESVPERWRKNSGRHHRWLRSEVGGACLRALRKADRYGLFRLVAVLYNTFKTTSLTSSRAFVSASSIHQLSAYRTQTVATAVGACDRQHDGASRLFWSRSASSAARSVNVSEWIREKGVQSSNETWPLNVEAPTLRSCCPDWPRSLLNS